jgi:hypothetical protein
MSGQIVGQVIGMVIGTMVGGPIGGAIGGSLGGAVGSSFDSLPTQYGPRLDDLRAQKSEYGAPIPIVYGTAAIQGSVIWAADIKEVTKETEQGGKGGPSQTTVSYSYLGSFAILLSEGEIEGVGRIWAGPSKRLIWDGAKLESGTMRVYLGTDDQEPDPLIEQYEGVGNVPAYRGYAYIVIEDFELSKDGNTLPFLTIEVGASSGGSCPVPVSTISAGGYTYSIYDPAPVKLADAPTDVSQYGRVFSDAITGWSYYTYADQTGYWYVNRVNPSTGESGPPLSLGSGTPKISWNNQGLAESIEYGGTEVLDINLIGWATKPGPPMKGIVCGAGETGCKVVDLPIADVAWSDYDNMFRRLSFENNYDGYSVGVPAIEDVDLMVHRYFALQPTVLFESTGARTGGDLIPMWGDTAAASFSTQDSNLARAPNIFWDAYDFKHKLLVDFTAGVYNSATGGGYIDTAGFAISGLGVGQAVYSPDQDMFYVVDGLKIRAYDPEKLSPLGWQPEDCVLFNGDVLQAYENGEPILVSAGMRVFALANEPDWLGVVTGGGHIMKIFVGEKGKTKASGVPLSEVVADLSDRAGESHYDVSALTDMVDGYVVARQTQVRAAIDALRPAYYFDAVESQGVIKYVKRGGSAVATIDDADLAAHDADSDSPDPLKTVRRMEVELPRTVNVKYLLAADDYSQATKTAKRLIGASGDEQTIEVPLVMTDTKAQEVAEVNLHAAWAERLSYQFTLPRKYSYLEPTDLIVVKGHLMRLTKINATPRGILECEAVADETTYYAPHAVVTETQPNDNTVTQPGATLMELF